MHQAFRIGRLAPALAIVAASAAPLAAQSGSFLIKLGRDTIGAEHYEISGNTLKGEVFTRQPRTSHLTYVATLAPDGSVTHLELTRATTNPQNAPVVVMQSVDYRNDSAYLTIKRNDSTINRVGPAAKGSVPGLGSTVYAMQELAVMRAIKNGAPLTILPLQPPGGPQPNNVPLSRAGDTLVIAQAGFPQRVRLDREGHFVSGSAPNTTFLIEMTRVPSLDIAKVGNGWIAQESQKGAFGQLSRDDTVRAAVGGATVSVSFGRPSLRGRQAFGTGSMNPVRYGEVWRTGANWATALTTDKDLVINGTTIPAGKYTLWTIPEASGQWKLVVSKKTISTGAQSKGRFLWGTEYDPAEDLARVDITAKPIAQPVETFDLAIESAGQGGVIKITWDKTQVAVPFAVKP